MVEKPVQMIFRDCGSELVTRDAWAEWDVEMQDWVLGAVYDYAFCHCGEQDAHIEEIPLVAGRHRVDVHRLRRGDGWFLPNAKNLKLRLRSMADPFAQILTPANLATALIALNFVAFAAFGIDKIKAEKGWWRVQESTLLMLALLGGTPGAYAGRAAFRHKTRKQPFSSRLHTIAVLQVLALGVGVGWMLGG